MSKSFRTLLLLVLLSFTTAVDGGWRELYPIYSGGVSLIAADAGGDVYAVGSGGLFRSSAGIGPWTSALGNLPTTAVSTLTPDPVQVGTLYAGTDKGLFRSDDSGGTWTRLPLNIPAGMEITGIAVAPANTDRIFVATWGSYVWRSLDRGATWSQSSSGLFGGWGGPQFIPHIAADPNDANRVYTSTWRGQLFRSDNAAASWTAIGGSGTWAIFDLQISRSQPNVLYATHDEYWFGRGTVIRSSDYGNTWTNAGRPAPYAANSTNIGKLAVDPANPNVVYVTTNQGVHRTTTGGGTWPLIFTPSPRPDMGPIAVDAANALRLFAGSPNSGFYRSTNGGLTWSAYNTGMAISSVTGLVLCRDVPTTLYAAAQGVGYVKSADGGLSWTSIGNMSHHSVGAVAVHPQNPNIMVTASYDGTTRLWRTADGGTTFSATSTGYGPWHLRFNPLDPSYVHGPISDWQGGFLRSADAGATWSVPYWWYIYPTNFVFHPTLPNVVFSVAFQYTGAAQNTLWVVWSNNYGGSWTGASFGKGGWRDVALDQNDPSKLYAAGLMPSEGTEGVYRFNVSYSGGSVSGVTRVAGTFNGGLANASVRKLHYDKAKGYLYASTPNGVFRTSDSALTWSSINEGLPHPSTDWLAGTPDGERLYVSTSGGIWEYADSLPVPVAVPVVKATPSALLHTPIVGLTNNVFLSGETTTAADTITLTTSALAPGMTFTATSGNPASGQLAFTAGGNQRGQTYSIDFTATSTLDPLKSHTIKHHFSVIGDPATDAVALIGTGTDGRVNTPDGQFSLDIPAGAIPGGTSSAVNVAYESNYRRADVYAEAPSGRRGRVTTLTAYDITIDGLAHFTFASPVALTFAYPAGIDPASVIVMTFNDATQTFEPRTDTSCLAYFGRQPITGSAATGGTISICTTTVSLWAIVDASTFVFNAPPVANAGLDRTIEATAPNTSVTLDGTASTDPDGDALTYTWTGPFGTATGAQPTVLLPLGTHTITLTVDDGNGETDSDTVVIKLVDTTAPAVTILVPANGAAYLLNQSVTASYQCTDAVTGVATCTATAIDTAVPGPHTFTVTATDHAGNSASASTSYFVRYLFSGFLQPLKASMRAGQTLPLKWQLRDAAGAFVSSLGSIVSIQTAPIACGAAPAPFNGEPATPAGNTTPRYDAAENQFVFNWQTQKEWTGCRALQLTLNDGAQYWLTISFEK